MKIKAFVTNVAAVFAATLLLWLGPAANAQSAQVQESSRFQSDITREELAFFDEFLDSHREIAEQLRKDPSLAKNGEFLLNHPALQTYLQQHPGIREELREDPNAFMRKENRYDRREDARNGDRGNFTRDRDTTREELASFDRFLDRHRQTAEQLRKDPTLAKNQEFLNKNPDLRTYLQEHPAVRDEINENPNAFMRSENRFDQREEARNNNNNNEGDRDRDRFRTDRDSTARDRDDDARRDRDMTPRDRDVTRGELSSFDQFLDHHRETSEQLRKNPSLIRDQQFLASHPELQSYLQSHKEVREELNENPNAFMRSENHFDQRENGMERGADRGHAASFGKFLNGHSEISEQLSKNPSLVKNREYLENHPELREYLKANPGVQNELSHNPQSFIKSAQEFHTGTYNKGVKTPTPPPTPETKPPKL